MSLEANKDRLGMGIVAVLVVLAVGGVVMVAFPELVELIVGHFRSQILGLGNI